MSKSFECKVAKCPVCDNDVTVQLVLTPGEMDAPEPGTPTWMLLRTTALQYLFGSALKYASKMTLWERKQIIDAITSDTACKDYSPMSLSNLNDFLCEGAEKCRKKASEEVARLARLEEIESR